MTPPPYRRIVRPPLAVAMVAAISLLTACTPTTSSVVDDSPTMGIELSNCGVPVSISAPPERVVTIKSTSTEMLLALGLGDRIVGSAFSDGPLADDWAADAADIPVISDFVPSQEAVLELEPDFIYGGWESNFSADGAGERNELASLGIASYVSPAACQSADIPGKLDFDEVFREIQEVADIFDVDASPLIADQRAELAAIEVDGRGLTALWYSSGTDVPYVGAGLGAPQMVLDAVGLENIAREVEMTWTSLGWEAIIEANPDVIVLVDATWNTAASKVELLESNPATAELDAVVNERYLIVPFPAAEAGVRSVAAATSIAAQLDSLEIP